MPELGDLVRWNNGNESGHWERCGKGECIRAIGHEGECRPRRNPVLLSPGRCSGCGGAVYWGRRQSWNDYPPRWRNMDKSVHRCVAVVLDRAA